MPRTGAILGPRGLNSSLSNFGLTNIICIFCSLYNNIWRGIGFQRKWILKWRIAPLELLRLWSPRNPNTTRYSFSFCSCGRWFLDWWILVWFDGPLIGCVVIRKDGLFRLRITEFGFVGTVEIINLCGIILEYFILILVMCMICTCSWTLWVCIVNLVDDCHCLHAFCYLFFFLVS